MGMLMRRHYTDNKNKAEGATQKVAPKPTPSLDAKEEKPVENLTKADIQKMNAATVRAYAEKQGIKDVADKSGAELKRILIGKMFDDEEN